MVLRSTKTRVAIGAAAVALALLVTGCSSGSSAGGSQSKDALTWSMWIAGKEDKAAWQKVADTSLKFVQRFV